MKLLFCLLFLSGNTKIPIMTYKSTKKRVLSLIPVLSYVLAGTPVISAEELSDSNTELQVIELESSDIQPLETIKNAVLSQYYDEYDAENTVISVSPFSQVSAGLNSVVVNIDFVNDDAGVGTALSVPVLIRNILSDDPSILLTSETVSVKKNSDFDPLAYIAEITDGSGSGILPALSVDSNVDTKTNGTYTVNYTVTNMHGHSASAALEVEVYTPVLAPGENVDLSTLMINDDGSVYAMFEAINAVRAAYGLYPYVLASEAGMTASAIRAQECTYFLSHTRPDGTPYHTVMAQVGEPHGSMVWEILVAYGNSVESNLNWWLNEPGHAACVLGTFGTIISIGHSGNVWEAMVY